MITTSTTETPTPSIQPLPADDPFFEAVVHRLRNGFDNASISMACVLVANGLGSMSQAEQWFQRFVLTVQTDVARWNACDDSKCKDCRWAPLCTVFNRRQPCPHYLSAMEKEWNLQAKVILENSGQGSWRRLVLQYDRGFIISRSTYSNTDGMPRQGPWKEFIKMAIDFAAEFPGNIRLINPAGDGMWNDTAIIRYGIRPRRNECLTDYHARVDRLWAAAREALINRDKDVHEGDSEGDRVVRALRAFIERLGQTKILDEVYGGNVLAMVHEYWPEVDPSIIEAENRGSTTDQEMRKMLWEFLRRGESVPAVPAKEVTE